MNPNILFDTIFTKLDWFVFIIVIIFTFAAVLYGNWLKTKTMSRNSGLLDYLIMGRQLTLPLFVGTLVATWYGGIFGVTQIAFEKGIYNFITQGLFWYIAYIIFALFIIQKVKPYNAITLPDLVEKMFGPYSAKLTAIFNFFNVLPIAYVISIGLLLKLLIGGTLLQMMLLGIIIVIFYSMFGGFRAVVFSDLVQFFVMCSAVVLVLVLSIYNYGGINFLIKSLPENHFLITGGESILSTLAWGLIAMSTLVDPNFYQRVFAAKSEKVARNGIFISTFIWFCFDICTTLGAMYARALIPEADSSSAYLTYALQLLPSGLRGFFIAGIAATILSTLDSYLFLAGTTISYDLAPKKYRGKTWPIHLGIIFVGLLAVLMGVFFDGNIKLVWKTLGSYSAACLLVPILYGHIFPKKISDMQFIFSSILGLIATTYWRLVPHYGFFKNIDELYAGIIATTIGITLFPVVSKMTKSKI